MQAQRDGAHRAQVGGHVLAGAAVAARRAAHEAAALVAQADRQPVDLELADVGHRRVVRPASQSLANPGVELAELIGAEGVAEAEHGHVVPDRWEAALHRGADALGGRVLRHQLRVGGLELDELAEEQVVRAVAHGRRIQHVVAVVRVLELGAQLGGAGGGVGGGHRLRF